LTSALVGDAWSASRPDRFIPGKRASGTYWTGDWVHPRDGTDDVEKRKILILSGLKLRPFSRPDVYSRYTDYALPAPSIYSKAAIYGRKFHMIQNPPYVTDKQNL
jgi:hypothetical protein